MGILDDAIREHLDLKRRLGGDDDEIERLENEAFGPPTRPGEPDFPETGEELVQAPEAVEPEVLESEAVESEALFDHTLDESDAPAAPPADEPVVEVPFEVDDPASHLDVLSEPATAESGPPIESLDTVEHHFEDAIEDTGETELVEPAPVEAQPAEPGPEPAHTDEHPAEEGEEDVLEETPEFLRDQPEDDELWFEQGEPKDFDF